MQLLDLDLDKENELIFKLSVMGTRPATTKSRFLLEYNDFSFSFPAKNLPDGEVSVLIPPLENMITEGRYEGSLEVIIDEKVVFTPMKVTTDFKKSVNIVAEVVSNRRPETQVTVSQIVSVNKKPASKEVIKEKVVSESVQAETLPPAAKAEVIENQAPAIKTKKSNSKPSGVRKKPPQRNRKRPSQSLGTKANKEKQLIEQKINSIAKQKDVSISQDQMSKIIKLIKNKGKKK